MRHAQVLQFRPVLPMRSVISGAEAGVYPVEKEPALELCGRPQANSTTTDEEDQGVYDHDVTEPRRVLIDWDYGAHGIWWVLTRQEKEAPAPGGRWSGAAPPYDHERIRPWSNRLTSELLDDLQEWNDSWDSAAVDAGVLQERGRDLAIRVQDELGTDGWEVLYKMGGQVRRVHPPGSWPAESWQQQLLGYGPRRRQPE